MLYKIIKEKRITEQWKRIVGTFILVFQLNMTPLLGLAEVFKYLSEAFFELFSSQQHFKKKKE